MNQPSQIDLRALADEREHRDRLKRRLPNYDVFPGYTGPGTGYLGTGFTLLEVCAMDIREWHPAVMRYEAFKEYIRRVYPKRGMRPAEARKRLSSLRGNARQAAHLVTEKSAAGYEARQRARYAGVAPEQLPVVTSPRGAAARGLKARARASAVPRPPLGWREQALQDMRVLIEMRWPIPFSRTPTQTRYRPGKVYAVEAVPLSIAYHSPMSCSGLRYSDRPDSCPHCLYDGKRHTSRVFAVAHPDEVLTGPTIPRELEGLYAALNPPLNPAPDNPTNA